MYNILHRWLNILWYRIAVFDG